MNEKKGTLLIVDDIELNRLILEDLFTEHYDVLQAENGQKAYEIIKAGSEISALLLDIMMPVMDGLELLKKLKDAGSLNNMPVVLITGSSNDEKALEGYRLGVADIIVKPFNSDIVFRRVNNIVDLYSHQKNLERRLREQKEMLERQSLKLRQANQFVVEALSAAVGFRNLESGEHVKRVRTFTYILLQAMRTHYTLSDDEIDIISNSSVIHDIGKIAIPDNILLKPGRLTSEEFEIMKQHTLRGCEILKSLNYTQRDEYYKHCYYICRHHHERWDGRGYPDGLKGDEISIGAQVTSLADVYDALTNERVYKAAYSHDEAMDMILNGECGVFNPLMLQYFKEAEDQLRAKG